MNTTCFPPLRSFAIILFVALFGACFVPRGQAQLPPPGLPSNAIPPTVTATMGDMGGKFFGKAPDPARTRHYYIAAEPELWDYAPLGSDPICGKPLPPPVMAQRKGGKIRYVQYAEASMQARVTDNPRLGVLGPVLRGTVGDYLAITFLNRTWRPLSMHPHGVKYDKDSEGSYYEPKPGLGAAVGPGAKFTYVWHLDEDSGPMPDEPSSKGWLYHSHVSGDEEANLGLIGTLIVTDPKRARPDGTPSDVDREMAALFMLFDESGLGEAEKEAAEYANMPGNTGLPPKTWAQVGEMMEAGTRAAINGLIFGNLTGLEMNEGERVRWYLFGLGSEEDMHTAHWHGLRVVEEGRRRTDVVELLPASMKVADMRADNPGSWLFHCHVADHMMEGMFARVIVHPKESKGVSRAPQHAFFGMREAEQTMEITRAEAVLNTPPGDPAFKEVRFEGKATVFHAFSVFTQAIKVQIGEKTSVFKPNNRGVANTAEGSFRTKNASQFGVIYGGRMDFELTLAGADWSREFTKLGLSDTARELSVPCVIHIGAARHNTTARVTVR